MGFYDRKDQPVEGGGYEHMPSQGHPARWEEGGNIRAEQLTEAEAVKLGKAR